MPGQGLPRDPDVAAHKAATVKDTRDRIHTPQTHAILGGPPLDGATLGHETETAGVQENGH
eukprot:8077010-Lingulodinium_polyedra.AAC.1